MDYFKLLPLLTLLVFALPVKFQGWWTFAVVLTGSALVSVSALGTLCNLTTPLSIFSIPFTPIGALFALAVALVGVSTSLYAIGYLRAYQGKKSQLEFAVHYSAFSTLIYSMFLLLSATHRFDFLLWWELMTLSSFALILFNARKKEVFHAAVSYLIVMHVGFFCLLLGFGRLPGDALWGYGSMPIGVWIVMLIGFGLKAGIFPLHIWLPIAHPAAPSHVSALMSGVMINMGLYGIIMITLNTTNLLTAGYVLFILGAVTTLFGITKATVQNDLKRLLAYSSIENIGIMLLGFGLGVIGKASSNAPLALAGIGGALLHMLNHASYKSMLFMSGGSIVSRTHSSDMSTMGGLFRRMPITGTLFLCATLAICAIPPFSGFFSEFTMLSGLFASVADGNAILEGVIGLLVLAIAGGLTILAFCKAFGTSMLGVPRSALAAEATEVQPTMIAALALPLVSIVLGAMAYPYLILGNPDLLTVSADPTTIIRPMWHVEIAAAVMIVLVVGLIILRHVLQRKRAITAAPTWGCAFGAPTPDIQYTAHAVSAELEHVLRGKPAHSPLAEGEVYPGEHSFSHHSTDTTGRLFSRFGFRILRRWTARLALFQTGRTNHYILYALLFLLLILILSVVGIL